LSEAVVKNRVAHSNVGKKAAANAADGLQSPRLCDKMK
jgi:hypothetical protein